MCIRYKSVFIGWNSDGELASTGLNVLSYDTCRSNDLVNGLAEKEFCAGILNNGDPRSSFCVPELGSPLVCAVDGKLAVSGKESNVKNWGMKK